MSIVWLRYAFRRTALVWARHPLVLLSGVVVAAVCLYGLSWIGFTVLRTPQAIPAWLNGVDAVVYLRVGASAEVENRAVENLRSMPAVAGVRLVSREETLGGLERQLGRWKGMLSGIEKHSWRSSVEVTLQKRFRAPELRQEAMERIRSIPEVGEVLYGNGEGERIKVFIGWAEVLGWILTALLILASFGIYWSLALRMMLGSRDEVHVLAWAGASEWMIRLPFLLTVWLVGALGVTIAVSLFAASLCLLSGILPLPVAALLSLRMSEGLLLGALLFLVSLVLGYLGVRAALGRKRDWLGHVAP